MKHFLLQLWKKLNLKRTVQLFLMRIVNDSFIIGTTGIIFNNKNEVLLVKHSYRQIAWSLPGGYLKAREHPLEGLEREILEETGFVVSIDSELKIRTDRERGRLDITYVGTFIGGEFKENEEVKEYGFFSFDKLPLLLKDQVLFIDYALRQRVKEQQLLSTRDHQKNKFLYPVA